MMCRPELAIGLAIVLMLRLGCVGAAADISATSSVTQVSLVELYTSEGCSSCPPAESWFSTLADQPGLWQHFVPAAFHVDYWNDLGWKDRFASPVFTHRQRKYREQWQGRYLYTPCVAVNGQEWPGWRQQHRIPVSTNSVGRLSLSYDDGNLRLDWSPEVEFAKAYDAYVCLLGMGLESDVTAGENSGRVLAHDFVVLQYAQRRVKQRKGQYYDRMKLDAGQPPNVARRALVAWVTGNKSMVPLQAVGVLLPAETGNAAP